MTIADKVLRAKDDYDAVYEAGYEKGSAEGGEGSYDQGYADGKQAEYDLFWDNFQQNGECRNYDSAFRGDFFNDAIYNPAYPIIASDTYGASYMYMNNKRLTDTKVTVSVPGLGNGMVFYQASRLKRIPTLEISDKTTFSNWFAGCSALEEMNVVGTIAQNEFDVHWSTKLSRNSIIGVVNALSPTTTGLTVTLSKTAVENAFDGTPVPVEEYVELSPSCYGDEYSFETSFSGNVASVTVNGGRSYEDEGGSSGAIYFINNVLPAGEYEISFSTAGDSESNFYLACGNTTTGEIEPLSPGGTIRVTINDGEVLHAGLDLAGSHNNFTASVSIKRIEYVYDWESLAATKPNWTITLV